MKAVGYQKSLPIEDSQALLDLNLPQPTINPRDLLVKIEAVSVNPVDTKIRQRVQPQPNEYQILGWDACGVVMKVGEEVTMFKKGDRVWYAGAIDRQGTNSGYHLVDEAIVAHAPQSLDSPQAAALPLTSITAWELLFDRFQLTAESQGTILIIGGAGGVGSMMIQLAKQLTNLKVIATASREETQNWVKSLGADYIVNHHDLANQIKQIGIDRGRIV